VLSAIERLPEHPAATPARLLVTIEEACTALGGISRPTMYALIKRRDVVKCKQGSRSFVTVESLRQYIDRLIADEQARVEQRTDEAREAAVAASLAALDQATAVGL
jgi:hypothetical protein